ncbi:MAG: SH3 domain-containing protein [Novosphingobium sp.]
MTSGQAALMRDKAGRYADAMPPSLRFLVTAACLSLPGAVSADDSKPPYWASIRAEVVNMRVGPGEEYRILWTYRRKSLPLKVVRMREGWRLVEDPDGAKGWVTARFLTRDRSAIVAGHGLAEMREKADSGSQLKWRLEPGVTGKLGDCSRNWCLFDVEGRAGYVLQERLWGAGAP